MLLLVLPEGIVENKVFQTTGIRPVFLEAWQSF